MLQLKQLPQITPVLAPNYVGPQGPVTHGSSQSSGRNAMSRSAFLLIVIVLPAAVSLQAPSVSDRPSFIGGAQAKLATLSYASRFQIPAGPTATKC
jgi:hypothetical protein